MTDNYDIPDHIKPLVKSAGSDGYVGDEICAWDYGETEHQKREIARYIHNTGFGILYGGGPDCLDTDKS